jgi:hypothetical protein
MVDLDNIQVIEDQNVISHNGYRVYEHNWFSIGSHHVSRESLSAVLSGNRQCSQWFQQIVEMVFAHFSLWLGGQQLHQQNIALSQSLEKHKG